MPWAAAIPIIIAAFQAYQASKMKGPGSTWIEPGKGEIGSNLALKSFFKQQIPEWTGAKPANYYLSSENIASRAPAISKLMEEPGAGTGAISKYGGAETGGALAQDMGKRNMWLNQDIASNVKNTAISQAKHNKLVGEKEEYARSTGAEYLKRLSAKVQDDINAETLKLQKAYMYGQAAATLGASIPDLVDWFKEYQKESSRAGENVYSGRPELYRPLSTEDYYGGGVNGNYYMG